MKPTLKIFKDESFELEMLIKYKINLLQSPIDLINEKEIKELKTLFHDYTKRIDKLKSSMLTEEDDSSTPRSPHIIKGRKIDTEVKDEYDEIMNLFKNFQIEVGKLSRLYEERCAHDNKITANQFERRNSIVTENNDLSELNEEEKLSINKIFLNSIITVTQIENLMKTNTLEEERNYIKEIFNLTEFYPKSVSKQNILLDFYLNNYKFCLKQKFTIEKSSTFLSIIYFMFSYSLINKKIIKDKSRELFCDIMNFHSINRPPYSFEIFTVEEKEKVLDFVDITFFRNYSLFENIFKYNVNIYFTARNFRKIPPIDFPLLFKDNSSQLSSEYLTQADGVTYIQKMYIEKITPVQVAPVKQQTDEIKKKTPEEIYEEAQMEKLNNFISSFYKNNSQYDPQRIIDEQLKAAKLVEMEKNEAKDYLEAKIPEIVKESVQKVNIANKILFTNTPSTLDNIKK